MGSILIMGIVCFVLYVNGKLFLIKIGLIDYEQINESKKVNMTSKERGQYIRDLLGYYQRPFMSLRTQSILLSYFGIDTDKSSLEELGDEYECSTRQIRYRLNKVLNRIRDFVIHHDKMIPPENRDSMRRLGISSEEEVEEEREKCKQLKEYVEGINPDLTQKELPYYYSKFLDEFMLCLIDGVENTTSRSSKKYKIHMILREIGEMSQEERKKTGIFKDNGMKYRSKRLKEMGDGMYKWDYLKGLIEKI